MEYTDLTLGAATVGQNAVVSARVTLSNRGTRAALETVQVYVRDLVTSASWADEELKAFTQVHLEAGDSVTVEVEVPVADCSIVDAAGRRVVEPGWFELLVGPSSRNEALLAAVFEVEGEDRSASRASTGAKA